MDAAYKPREDLRQIWSQPDKDTAGKVLEDWIARAQASGIRPLARIAATLANRRFGILAWYDHRITSGPMEGTNNNIKTLKRQAYGFRDQEFFKLRIMGFHEAKYALTGGGINIAIGLLCVPNWRLAPRARIRK